MEMKRLNFNIGSQSKKNKCQRLHIGKDKSNCFPLYVRNKPMDHVYEISYLGDLVNGSGSQINNIRNRVAKGKGIIADIFNILETISFGTHYFEIALLLRRSVLINSVIYNSAVWNSLSSNEASELNEIGRTFFTRLCKVPRTATFVSFFLEFGEMELSMYIKARRVLYFFSLVKRNKTRGLRS